MKPAAFTNNEHEAEYLIYKVTKFDTDTEESEMTFDPADTSLVFSGTAYLADRDSAIDVMPIIRDHVSNDAVCDFTKGYDGGTVIDPEPRLRAIFTDVADFPIDQYFYVVLRYNRQTTNALICTWYEYAGESRSERHFDVPENISIFPLPETPERLVEHRFIDGTYISNTYRRSDYKDIFVDNSIPMDNIYLRGYLKDGTEMDVEVDAVPMRTSLSVRGKLQLSEYFGESANDVTNIQFFDYVYDAEEDLNPIGPKLRVERCVPSDTFILYYQNLYGAIDWIACTLKSQVTSEVVRNTIEHRPYDTDRTKFGKEQYLNIGSYRWTLNTELLNDRQSERMKNLFYSTKVWLYDPRTDRLHTVVITDQTMKIKKYDIDRYFNYTITCQSSTTFDIR